MSVADAFLFNLAAEVKKLPVATSSLQKGDVDWSTPKALHPDAVPDGMAALESFRLDAGETDGRREVDDDDWYAGKEASKGRVAPMTRPSRMLSCTVLHGFQLASDSFRISSESRWQSSASKTRRCARANLAGPLHRMSLQQFCTSVEALQRHHGSTVPLRAIDYIKHRLQVRSPPLLPPEAHVLAISREPLDTG